MKTLFVSSILLISSLTFAQSGGISGPGTSGARIASDERVLTAHRYYEIVADCMSVELATLARLILKDPRLEILPDAGRGGGRPPFEYRVVSAFNGVFETMRVPLRNPDAPNDLVQVDVTIDSVSPKMELAFGKVDAESMRQAFYLQVVIENAPVQHIVTADLPEAFDEYGRANLTKILVIGSEWYEPAMNTSGLPVGYTDAIQLLNAESFKPIAGTYFNRKRYKACVDLKVGKYAQAKQ